LEVSFFFAGLRIEHCWRCSLSARKLRDPTPTTAAAMAAYYLIATDFFWFYLQFHKTIKLLFLFGASELEEEIPLYLGRLSVSFFFFCFQDPQEIITVLEESHRASSSTCWVVS
jgi:hypothetical protein